MQSVTIYTDGSAKGNPGPGGYGVVMSYRKPDGDVVERELSGGFSLTTNNRMEIMAVIVALEALKRPCSVLLHSDSQYVVGAFNEHWIDNWQRNNWKKAHREPVKNVDLWKRLLKAKEPHDVRFVWVKGHAGNEGNERCDRLATEAADGSDLAADEGFVPETASLL